MFCKKRKARKAAKNSAVVAAMAMAEKADDLNIPGHADMFAEKLTGKKKAMKKARKATSKTARKAHKELARIERNGGKRPRSSGGSGSCAGDWRRCRLQRGSSG